MTEGSILPRHERYFEVLKLLDEPLGDWRQGEIQIITDPELIAQAEAKHGIEVGVIDEDRYVLHLRDAVFFPPKAGQTEPVLATYIRFVYAYQLKGNPGISILPVTKDGLLVLNRTFRHALRRWVIEAAGTIAKDGETRLDSIIRCVKDELGSRIHKWHRVTDHFVPERGLVGGTVPIYVVVVDYEPSEVADATVSGHVLLTPAELAAALRAGKYHYQGRDYHCCDGYTIAAVRFAELHGLI
jgi:hypothetical protein